MESGIAIGVSITALVVSIISPVFEYWWNKSIRQKNIESDYFISLFGDIIYQELPKAREYIHYDGKAISGTDELEKVLRSIRHKLIFYKQNNPSFYSKLISQVQEFEDFLVSTQTVADSDKFISYHNKVDEYIADICQCLYECYKGKK